MIKQLPAGVHKKLGHYVYVYIDPFTNRPFYIGRGKGDRVLNHLYLQDDNDKVAQIATIRARGGEPRIVFLRHGLTFEQAKLVEAAAIDLVGKANLTNLQAGHHESSYGVVTLEDVVQTYAAKPVKVRHKVILITINKLFRSDMSEEELYEATRGVWKVGRRREGAEYAMAVYEGIVRGVYRIERWLPAGSQEYRTRNRDELRRKGRWEFKGERARDLEPIYLNRSVGKGGQNPIRYKNVPLSRKHPGKTGPTSRASNDPAGSLAMVITINKLYRPDLGREELYEVTRGVWRVGERRNDAQYAFAVYRGIVRAVYRIHRWHPAGTLVYKFRDAKEVKIKGRWEFEGAKATELETTYLNQSVGKGGQNPIRYATLDELMQSGP